MLGIVQNNWFSHQSFVWVHHKFSISSSYLNVYREKSSYSIDPFHFLGSDCCAALGLHARVSGRSNLEKLGVSARFDGQHHSFQSKQLSSLACGFAFIVYHFAFHTYHTYPCIFSPKLQPHSIFIPIPYCQQLPVGTAAPTVTPNLFWYTQLPVSATFKNPACSYASLCCHRDLCSPTPNHVRESMQRKV